MPVKFYDRVMMTVASAPGTGATVALGSPVAGNQAFAATFADGDTLDYTLLDGNNWECGIGTYNAGANTLTRATTPDDSSNGGAPINASQNTIVGNTVLASVLNYLLDGQTRMTVYAGGKPSASEVIYAFVAVGAVAFNANFGGSAAASGDTTATAQTVFTVNKNGSPIGTITFAASAGVGTFATTGGAAETMVANDVLTVVGPGTPDTTLADIAITFNAYFTS